jgi:hypothetical protein
MSDAETKTFSSRKFDWINAVAANRALKSPQVHLAVVISRFVNEKTGAARVSDETLLAHLDWNRATLFRNRKALVDKRVLHAATPGKFKAHIYRMRFEFIDTVNEYLAIRREEREEARAEREAQSIGSPVIDARKRQEAA